MRAKIAAAKAGDWMEPDRHAVAGARVILTQVKKRPGLSIAASPGLFWRRGESNPGPVALLDRHLRVYLVD